LPARPERQPSSSSPLEEVPDLVDDFGRDHAACDADGESLRGTVPDHPATTGVIAAHSGVVFSECRTGPAGRLVLTVGTGYFVAQEFAYVAADRLALAREADAGDKRAARAVKVLERLSFMLSGAQLGITVTGLVVGFLAEPSVSALLEPVLTGIGIPDGAVFHSPQILPSGLNGACGSHVRAAEPGGPALASRLLRASPAA
jgi:hypothetical protein